MRTVVQSIFAPLPQRALPGYPLGGVSSMPIPFGWGECENLLDVRTCDGRSFWMDRRLKEIVNAKPHFTGIDLQFFHLVYSNLIRNSNYIPAKDLRRTILPLRLLR